MVIAKLFNITLDSKKTKIVRDKDLQMFVGDDVILNISIIENNESKPFNRKSTITVLYTNEGKTIEQKNEGITIIDNYNGIVEIKPKPNSITKGNNIITITISDEDENITLQQFILTAMSSTNDSILVDRKDDIETLSKLSKIIENIPNIEEDTENLSIKIDKLNEVIDDNIIEMENKIKDSIETLSTEVHDTLVETSIKADEELQKVQDKVNGQLEEINEMFDKSVQLESYLNSNNKVCFKSDVINKPAKELVNYSFIIHINTSPYVSSIITPYIGILTFSVEPSGVVATLNTLWSKSVQGNSISASVQFSNNSNTITNINDYGYKIILTTTGIASSLNNSKCVLRSISGGLI